MRTAISPRLAMRSLWIVMDCLQASHVDLCDRLTGHHGLLILGKEAQDLARCACLHLVERLHDLDETNRVVLRDRVALAFVAWLFQRAFSVYFACEVLKQLR